LTVTASRTHSFPVRGIAARSSAEPQLFSPTYAEGWLPPERTRRLSVYVPRWSPVTG
jgi:hypothetical protein